MFDENPTYNFEYKVADDEAQTYVTMNEGRQDNVVTGMYSYVDPLVSAFYYLFFKNINIIIKTRDL